MREIIENKTFDQERALYNSNGLLVKNCRFDGPADGESALKESRNVELENCFFNLRYPFWHDDGVKITDAEMTEICNACMEHNGFHAGQMDPRYVLINAPDVVSLLMNAKGSLQIT